MSARESNSHPLLPLPSTRSGSNGGVRNSGVFTGLTLETRTSGAGHIWALLRSTLDADSQDAQAMLEASGMKIPQGSLTLVIDEQGVYYRLPIAIINDPDEYEKDPNKEKLDNK